MKSESDNVLLIKSYDFAKSIVIECKKLPLGRTSVLLSQLLKAGTSIGANSEEAVGGQSSKDFFAKLSIAYKEARESRYWLRLMRDTDIMDKQIANHLISKSEELLRIIGSIQISMKNSGKL